MKIEEFGQKIKAKYPQYQDLPDADLGQKMINKYPQYKDLIDMPEVAKKQNTLLDNPVTRGIQNVFPGKKVGEAIGTLGGFAKSKLQGTSDFYDTSAPTPLQVAGDVAQGALTVAAPGVGRGATVAGRIGANTALGAGVGASGAIAQGQEVKDVAKEAAIGGAIGGVTSSVGEGIRSLSQNLPKWLTKAALPKLENKNLNYAVENTKIGSLKTLQEKSGQAIKSYEDSIQGLLSQTVKKGVPANSQTILDDAIAQFPDSNYGFDDLIDNAKSIAPKVSKLIDKFKNGTATIQEVNSIRKELDAATKSVYTSLNRPPEAKLLGATLSNSMRNYVQTNVPATSPIFKQYSQEIGLNKAIAAAVKKGEQKITFKDIIAGGAGFSQGGFTGALQAIIAERLLFNPAGQIGVAKAIQSASKAAAPVGTALMQGGKAPLIKGVTNSEEIPLTPQTGAVNLGIKDKLDELDNEMLGPKETRNTPEGRQKVADLATSFGAAGTVSSKITPEAIAKKIDARDLQLARDYLKTGSLKSFDRLSALFEETKLDDLSFKDLRRFLQEVVDLSTKKLPVKSESRFLKGAKGLFSGSKKTQ